VARPSPGPWVLFVMLHKEFRTHGGIDQESLLVKQNKDRNIVHSPDMGAGTSDNRCNGCSNIRGIYGGNVGWGGL
jgi:hypothetical protein